MSDAPLVSIAIRAYRRRWLAEAIGSVLTQTHRDLELVVYDDAGDLFDVAAAFDDARLCYHRPGERRDPAGRYKAAVALCRGRYVGLLDDDDRYEPDFVARLAAVLDTDPRAAAAVSRFAWDIDGRLVVPADSRPPGISRDTPQAFVDGSWVVTPSVALFRRSALLEGERRYPMPDGVAPDLFVNVRTAIAGGQFVLLDSPLVVKRWHPKQLSRTAPSAHHLAVATWQHLPTEDSELDGLRRRRLVQSHLRRAAWRLQSGDRPGAQLDLESARTLDARAWRWRRRALLAAVAAPGLGHATLRVHSLLPRVRRRRASPPDAGGGLVRGAVAVAVGSAGAQALLVLATPALTRLYTPAEFGAASVVAGAMMIGAPLACLRYDVAIPLARDRRTVAELCAVCFAVGAIAVSVLVAATALAGGALARAAHIPALAVALWLVPLQVPFAVAGLVATGLLVRRERYGQLGRARWASAAGACTTQVAGGAAGGGSAVLVGGAVAGAASYAVVGLAALRPGVRAAVTVRGMLATARSYRRFAAWSAVGAIFHTGQIAALPILVAFLYGPSEAGMFVLAQRVLQAPLQVVGNAVGLTWFGRAARLVRTDVRSLRTSARRLTAQLALGGAALLPIAVLAGEKLLGPVFGSAWSGAGRLLPALAVAQLALFVAIPAGQTLQALERTDVQAAVSAARLATVIGALVASQTLGSSLAAGVGFYAAGMTAVSVAAIAAAARLAGRDPAARTTGGVR